VEYDRTGKTDRERVKQASRKLLASLERELARMHEWTRNTGTQAQVKVFILDRVYESLPRPPYTDEETEAAAEKVYEYVWQRSAGGRGFQAA
jgi:type I restriction enzyme R subunit